MAQPKYCSIDLEFTGFDPESEQILEIGFAFFDITEHGLKVGETWSQVFKPSTNVHPKILGLTGISQEEIDAAPSVSEFREFLSEKLRDCVLVAHNPTLDVKFLEQAGVELSGQVIDTLELVQFLLPTYHSYNLENLMHYFGINHKDSHRALGDSLSTISLLERMLGIHAALPDDVKEQLASIYNRSDFTWAHLLKHPIAPAASTGNDSLRQEYFAEDIIEDFESEVVLDKQLSLHESRVAKTLQTRSEKTLLVLPQQSEVLRLWRAGLVEGVFETKDLFNAQGFQSFMKEAQTSEELRFCLKIVVWLATNWQTKTVLDLNLSFFGGQFKSQIVEGAYQTSEAKIAACDYETFVSLSEQNLETDRALVICDLQRFERFLTFGSREKLSWNYFSFVTKSIYNPETGFGREEYASMVTETLTSIDLFFGLVQIMLRQSARKIDYISLGDLEILQPVYYHRLVAAADNLAERLQNLGQAADHERLKNLGHELNRFFSEEPNQVKWVELGEENVALHSQPVKIDDLAQGHFTKYQGVKLTDTVSKPDLLLFLVERLGLNPEITKNLEHSIIVEYQQVEVGKLSELMDHELLTSDNAPLALVFPSAAAVKEFYKENFLALKERFKLFGQEYSGSGNKIFRNFRIAGNSMMLVTSQFINRQKYTAPARMVIYVRWPEVDMSQPYYQALAKEYQEKYENLSEILSQGNLVLNLKQLSGSDLPKVIVLGPSTS